MLGSANKPIVGLDIGSHSIKAIVLEQGKGGLVLRNMGVAHLPPEAIIDGSVEEKGIVVTTTKNLLKTLKVRIKDVCSSISGYSVIIKKISLPTATEKELADKIEVEAEQYIPFEIEDVNVDFEILGPSEKSPDQMDVILVAAKKSAVNTYQELLTESGLKPRIIDVDVFALENAFTQSYTDTDGTIALVDIGANKMNINIIRDGSSLMTKDAAMGGARVTTEIQDKFDLDYNDAEAIKIGGLEAPDRAAVEEIVIRAVGNWVAECQRAIEFLQASYPNEKLRMVYLSGGSSRINDIDRYFEQELKIPVKHLDPFSSIGINEKSFDPEYIKYMAPQVVICLGLALRRGEKF